MTLSSKFYYIIYHFSRFVDMYKLQSEKYSLCKFMPFVVKTIFYSIYSQNYAFNKNSTIKFVLLL